MNPKVQLHAIVRHDDYFADIADAVTVVAVVPTKEEALREVERLDGLSAGKRCRYFWTPTKYYPDGRGVASDG